MTFDGVDLTNRPPEAVARAGIARTFQIVKVFREMTVLDNVVVGAFYRPCGEFKAQGERGCDRATETRKPFVAARPATERHKPS